MTRREARRLALLIVWDDTVRSLDVSDEWYRHPETNEELSKEDVGRIKAEGRRIVDTLSKQADRLGDLP